MRRASVSISAPPRGTPVACAPAVEIPLQLWVCAVEKGLRRAILEKSFSFRARGTPVIGLSESLRQLPDGLFVGRASLTGKRIAVGHIGKKLQFPRTRHSRDRIAERAIRGGGAEKFAPCHQSLRQLPARVLFVGRASLARKRTAAGHIGKKLQFPRTRHSRDRTAEREIQGGGRDLRLVISCCATSRARAFCRASQLSSKKDCGGPYWKKASVSAHAALP